MTRGEQVICCLGLGKSFRTGTTFTDLLGGRLRGAEVMALRGVDLCVDRGETVGIVGPNGAGKSTLLRLIAALLLPDRGQLEVLGQDVRRVSASFRRRVCYVVSDERSFSWRLTGRQNLEFFAALHGLKASDSRKRVDHVLEMVEMRSEAARPVREYSTGMRQRLALARGLLGEPEIILFDELSRGLDPRRAARLRQMVQQELSAKGKTVLLATHDLSEIKQLCQRVVMIEQGQLMSEGPPQDVERQLGLTTLTSEAH